MADAPKPKHTDTIVLQFNEGRTVESIGKGLKIPPREVRAVVYEAHLKPPCPGMLLSQQPISKQWADRIVLPASGLSDAVAILVDLPLEMSAASCERLALQIIKAALPIGIEFAVRDAVDDAVDGAVRVAVDMETSVSKQWADLRRSLERELGVEGSAHWLAFAAKQQALRAQKLAERDVLEFPQTEWRP